MGIATFNNFSVISWQSVLLVEETEVPTENHQPATSHLPQYKLSLRYSWNIVEIPVKIYLTHNLKTLFFGKQSFF